MKKYTCNYLDCKSISFQPYCMFHRNTTEYINIIVKCIKKKCGGNCIFCECNLIANKELSKNTENRKKVNY